MPVGVFFRDRKLIYSDATSWKVDEAYGRLTVLRGEEVLATYNQGVWDLIRKFETSPTGSASASNKDVEKSWNSSLSPTIDVDFSGDKR